MQQLSDDQEILYPLPKAGSWELSISVLPKSIENIPEFILDKQNSVAPGSHKSKDPEGCLFHRKVVMFSDCLMQFFCSKTA